MLSDSLLTFNSLNANNRLCAMFDPVDDTIVEDDEMFVFTVNSMDSIVGGNSDFQFSVSDNDGKRLLFYTNPVSLHLLGTDILSFDHSYLYYK